MRIAYVCSDVGVPIAGSKGASIHVRALAQALQRLGHEVVIVTPRSGGTLPAGFDVPVHEVSLGRMDGITCELLASDSRGGAAVAREARAAIHAALLRERSLALLEDFRPDLVYERYSLFGTAGLSLAEELRAPLVLEVNAPLSDEQAAHRGLAFAETARALERDLLRSADHVIAVTRTLERWLVAERGVAPERVTVLPNAVDVHPFEAAGHERERVRTRLGVAREPLVGFLGTLKPWHGTATLVRAIALLHRRGLRPRLLVVGDGPERPRLEELARSEGIADATTFAGSVPHERVPAHLAALDVAVAPYDAAENFYFSPLKLFEYLAAARPVVAADVGEIAHCVGRGRGGYLYRAGDAVALADAIAELLDEPARAAALGEAGRDHVRAHHSWEGNARVVAQLARPTLALAEAV